MSVRQVCLATPNNCPVCLDPADAAASRSWQRPGGWPNDRDRRTSRLFEPLTAWRCIIQRCVPVSSKPGRGIFWGGWTSQCCWSDSAKTGAAREPLATLIGNSLSNSGSRLLKGLKLRERVPPIHFFGLVDRSIVPRGSADPLTTKHLFRHGYILP